MKKQDPSQKKSYTIDDVISNDTLDLIAQDLHFLDILHLREGLGSINTQHVNRLYTILHKRYFPHIEIPKEAQGSVKEFFLETIQHILETIEKIEGIKLSPYAFLQAGAGRLAELKEGVHWFGLREYAWLQGIQYHYYPDINNLPVHKKLFPANNAAKLSLCTKNHKFLEELLNDRGQLLTVNHKIEIISFLDEFFKQNKDHHLLEKLFKKYESLLLEQQGYRSPEVLLNKYEDLLELDENDEFLEDKDFSTDELSCVFYAWYNHFEKIKHLLTENLFPQIRAFVFANAAKHGNKDIVEFLIHQNKKKPLMQDSYKTGMHEAAENGQLNILKLLISVVTEEVLQDEIRDMLFLAATHGHIDIVKYLIDFPQVSLKHKQDAFTAAARFGHLKVLKFLFHHTPESYTTKSLLEAASSKSVSTMDFLLNHTSDNDSSITSIIGQALSQAIAVLAKNNQGMIDLLLQHAEKMGISREVKAWGLHHAVFHIVNRGENGDAITKKFFEKTNSNADPGILENAINQGHKEAVHCLLENVGDKISLQELGNGLYDVTRNLEEEKIVISSKELKMLSISYDLTINKNLLENEVYVKSLQNKISVERHVSISKNLIQYAKEKGIVEEVAGWALRYAVQNRDFKIMNMILRDPTLRSPSTEHIGAALYSSLHNDDIPINAQLLDYAQKHIRHTEIMEWMLHYAILNNDIYITEYILANIPISAHWRGEKLCRASLYGQTAIGGLLLRHSAAQTAPEDFISGEHKGKAVSHTFDNGNLDLASEILMDFDEKTIPNDAVGKLLLQAITNDETDMAQLLLQYLEKTKQALDEQNREHIGALLDAKDNSRMRELVTTYFIKNIPSESTKGKRSLEEAFEQPLKRRKKIPFREKRPLEEGFEKSVKYRKTTKPTTIEDFSKEKPPSKNTFKRK